MADKTLNDELADKISQDGPEYDAVCADSAQHGDYENGQGIDAMRKGMKSNQKSTVSPIKG